MVDYALILEDYNDEDYALYKGSCSDGTPGKRRRFGDRVAETLRRKGGASINQTRIDHVRYTPFAVSIETKRAAGEDEAHVQLAVWV
ncbi:uncharacterized protein K452DRAFT_238209 [Aplosporella prunicola CBS 121167]|uniref:PD-(D/E)XK nuclease-like domain-containing protein n=1 Tax=Aplosporella prunicola CBS 121167 TaxID=1176127 RepID=A0A6A6AYG6_9PEZI|nr:uncharacterized protein K452DRAFT_238209 [Aplosporella prunicola CBS 121167]KAF2136034.1 hypothetical protein K452DRAFT_238209 [Aplosporella prunicola CBS 121167]